MEIGRASNLGAQKMTLFTVGRSATMVRDLVQTESKGLALSRPSLVMEGNGEYQCPLIVPVIGRGEWSCNAGSQETND
jgi:hypothetical protein